jgi:hypothetical protein
MVQPKYVVLEPANNRACSCSTLLLALTTFVALALIAISYNPSLLPSSLTTEGPLNVAIRHPAQSEYQDQNGFTSTDNTGMETYIVMFADGTDENTLHEVERQLKEEQGAHDVNVMSGIGAISYKIPVKMSVQSVNWIEARTDVLSVEKDQVVYALQDE